MNYEADQLFLRSDAFSNKKSCRASNFGKFFSTYTSFPQFYKWLVIRFIFINYSIDIDDDAFTSSETENRLYRWIGKTVPH